ncbi:MAG: thioredoxin-dependent thiol peroxidase [Cytophagia bacterium]|nr:thioredoxin-dependent thiol peroxidase [Cytophagia bacterium]|tara:strand:+ start:1076 stop:1528 length:453 start_codon:yes stop_codon:yes gene_type:complete
MNLKIGDKAPDFEGKNQNNESVKLSSFIGEKIVLYFYPRDNTPGCTAQACNLKDNFSELSRKGYKIIGVSSDSIKSHKKFEEKYSLPFDLISDEDKAIHKSYGTWIEKSMYGRKYMGTARWTFIINENGIINNIIEKVKTKEHTNQILGE